MITTKWFEDITVFSDSYFIREKVFIQEQDVPVELEMDGTDEGAIHLVVYKDDVPVATGRIISESDDTCILGRVAVLKEYRGYGYGELVMRELIRKAYSKGYINQHLHAQIQALEFYKKLGFVPVGEEYMDVNIPHMHMIRSGDIQGVDL